ncbi:MAG: response regulator [Lachnospiraceae bacterium]|nr:response regulator [Lachnospiraceae bacterium]
MKKIFLIGKFNIVFEDLKNYLEDYFSVVVCTDNVELMKNMIKLNNPDLIIVNLSEMTLDNVDIFEELEMNHSYIPTLCIGTKEEKVRLAEIMSARHFNILTRPIQNEIIRGTICETLFLEYDYENGVIRDKNRKCVMIIDDSAIQLRALNEILKKKYDVLLATSGMKALTLIGKRVPDIIFLDYEMPICDGKMTFTMLKEIDEVKDIPIIFLTGVNDKNHIESVLELRPEGYLLKPASVETLFETIEKNLKRKDG